MAESYGGKAPRRRPPAQAEPGAAQAAPPLGKLEPSRCPQAPLVASPPDPLAPLVHDLATLDADQRRVLRTWQPTGAAGLGPWHGDANGGPDGGHSPGSSNGSSGGSALLDLASNDYLGLAHHPALVAAATAAMAQAGVGAGASRLVCGGRPIHAQLEQRLAQWLGRASVLLFPSGFQANLAAVGALADRHTLVLADRLIHHSLLLGIRACGARLQRFAHNDLADLERRLDRSRGQDRQRRRLVISESLFSMEGSSPDLAAMAALCRAHGAALLVDEAHALGVLGPGGRGLGHGLGGIQLISGTFGKAFGSGGAFLAGDGPVGDWLLQHSGPFRYTTALAPPLAAAALASLELLEATPQLGGALLARAARWRQALAAAGWPRPPGEGPILPLLVGSDAAALALQARLEQAGLLSIAIRPPTVPRGQARLRLVLRHDLPHGSLARLLAALGPGPGAKAPEVHR